MLQASSESSIEDLSEPSYSLLKSIGTSGSAVGLNMSELLLFSPMVSPRQSLGTLYAHRLWQLNLQSEKIAQTVQVNQKDQ